MPKTVADYEDAVRRIVDADVPPEATTWEEVLDALRDATAPQITEDVARNLADSVLTEDHVLEAIEATGELPEPEELEAFVQVSDDYEMGDRQDSVLESVEDRVATTGDLERAIERDRPLSRREAEAMVDALDKEIRGANREDVANSIVTVEDVVRDPNLDTRQTSDGIFREDVQSRTEELAAVSDYEDSGGRIEEVATEASRSIGAPSRQAVRQSQVQAVAQADQVTPAELGVSDRKGQYGVVTDQQGETVGVVGGTVEEDRETIAGELGAEQTFRTVEDLQDSMGLEQGEGEAHLTISGSRISEVDVE